MAAPVDHASLARLTSHLLFGGQRKREKKIGAGSEKEKRTNFIGLTILKWREGPWRGARVGDSIKANERARRLLSPPNP